MQVVAVPREGEVVVGVAGVKIFGRGDHLVPGCGGERRDVGPARCGRADAGSGSGCRGQ